MQHNTASGIYCLQCMPGWLLTAQQPQPICNWVLPCLVPPVACTVSPRSHWPPAQHPPACHASRKPNTDIRRQLLQHKVLPCILQLLPLPAFLLHRPCVRHTVTAAAAGCAFCVLRVTHRAVRAGQPAPVLHSLVKQVQQHTLQADQGSKPTQVVAESCPSHITRAPSAMPSCSAGPAQLCARQP